MLLNKVVVGSTVESALYAMLTDSYLIDRYPGPPLFYKRLSTPIFASISRSEVYTKLALMISLLGKRLPVSDNDSVRVRDKELRVISENSTFKYTFNSMCIFDSTGIDLENEVSTVRDKTFLVFDDFELSVLGKKKELIQPIDGREGFVKELHFYCSNRVDGANYVTDCVSESELTQEQLYLFDYSDTMARFVIERHLQGLEIKGSFMKYYKNGTPKYRKPNVKHVKRIVREKDNNLYKDSENIKFVNFTLEELIDAQSA
jgi:hypothetical protein